MYHFFVHDFRTRIFWYTNWGNESPKKPNNWNQYQTQYYSLGALCAALVRPVIRKVDPMEYLQGSAAGIFCWEHQQSNAWDLPVIGCQGERSSRNGSNYPFKSRRGTRDFPWAHIPVAVRLLLGATIISSGGSLMVGKENIGQVVNNMNLSASKPMLELGLFFPGRLEFSRVICMGDVIVVPARHITQCIMECEPANKQDWCCINWGNNFHTRVSIGAPKAYHRVLKNEHPCIKKQCACTKNLPAVYQI